MKIYYDEGGIVIIHGDCREFMASMRLPGVDVTITDPPYDEHTHANVSSNGTVDGRARKVELGFGHLTDPGTLAIDLLSRTRRWVLAFCAFEQLHHYRAGAGEDRWIRTGVFHRERSMPQLTGDRPGQAAEAVAIMHREGAKRWNGGGKAAYWDSPPAGRADDRHPTEKPLGLMTKLVSLFSEPGELVFDPFMGSGTTLRACKDLGRSAIGVEQDEHWCEVAANRLRQRVLPGMEV